MTDSINFLDVTFGYEKWGKFSDSAERDQGLSVEWNVGKNWKLDGDKMLGLSLYNQITHYLDYKPQTPSAGLRFGGRATYSINQDKNRFNFSLLGGPAFGRGSDNLIFEGGAEVDWLRHIPIIDGDPNDPKQYLGPQLQFLIGSDGSRSIGLGLKILLDNSDK